MHLRWHPCCEASPYPRRRNSWSTIHSCASSQPPDPSRILGDLWNIPFGRDRACGKSVNAVLNFVLGGWKLNEIITGQSGVPIAFSRTAVNHGTYVTVGPFLPDVRTDPNEKCRCCTGETSSASIHDQRITIQFRSE